MRFKNLIIVNSWSTYVYITWINRISEQVAIFGSGYSTKMIGRDSDIAIGWDMDQSREWTLHFTKPNKRLGIPLLYTILQMYIGTELLSILYQL